MRVSSGDTVRLRHFDDLVEVLVTSGSGGVHTGRVVAPDTAPEAATADRPALAAGVLFKAADVLEVLPRPTWYRGEVLTGV